MKRQDTVMSIFVALSTVLSGSLVWQAAEGDELVPASKDIVLSEDDVQALREKYRIEREKRLNARPEGQAQYARLVDLARTDQRFARMLADPYPKRKTIHPVTDDVEVCVVGTGYGGLCAGARLVEAGIAPSDIRMIDKAGDVGGTWYWNRYPGAMCDVESYVYMPLCEEMGYVPTQKYAQQPEIYAHSKMIAERYGLYEKACFEAQVTGMQWDEQAQMYTITSTAGDAFRARFVVMNFGTFTQAKLPRVQGIENFEGEMFHTSRWNYEYTGGSSEGNLDKLGDKSVAIIGTGATAIQCVPHLGAGARHLYVIQRTPSSVDIRNNTPTTREFAEKYLSKPGWQRNRVDNFMRMTQTDGAGVTDLVQDGWTDIIRNLQVSSGILMKERLEQAKKDGVEVDRKALSYEIHKLTRYADYQQMEKVRARADIIVHDSETAESLKPYYQQFCKRPCFHDDYLETFNRNNVTLVDTDGQGIDRFSSKGVVVNGKEIEVDCIVMATGFETGYNASSMGPEKLGYDIIGRNGIALSQKWSTTPEGMPGSGPITFEGYCSGGFPNLFMQNAPQGTFTINFVQQLDEVSRHFAHIIAGVKARGKTVFDVKPEKEREYLELMWKMSPPSSGRPSGCTPGYYNNEGKVPAKGEHVMIGAFPGGPPAYFAHMQKCRDEGTALDNFDLA